MATYFDTCRKKMPHSDADIQKVIEAAGPVAKDMAREQTGGLRIKGRQL